MGFLYETEKNEVFVFTICSFRFFISIFGPMANVWTGRARRKAGRVLPALSEVFCRPVLSTVPAPCPVIKP